VSVQHRYPPLVSPPSLTGRHNDADLWIKQPGISDGNCNPGDPPSGSWYQDAAVSMYYARVGW
jgi:endoglucanase